MCSWPEGYPGPHDLQNPPNPSYATMRTLASRLEVLGFVWVYTRAQAAENSKPRGLVGLLSPSVSHPAVHSGLLPWGRSMSQN